MEAKETAKIKESLFELPNLVKKLEAYFSTEKPAEKKDETKEEVKETPAPEQDFSSVIATIEKTFAKTSDFDTFKSDVLAESTKATAAITALTAKNEALEAKFTAQESTLKEVFELVKKIGETPVEESKFAKKDGAKADTRSKMEVLMEEAKELSKQTFKY